MHNLILSCYMLLPLILLLEKLYLEDLAILNESDGSLDLRYLR